MNSASRIRISLAFLIVAHATIGPLAAPAAEIAPAAAPTLTDAQWQEIGARVVLQYCKTPATPDTTLDAFEAKLPDYYKMPKEGTPTAAQSAVSQQAKTLFLAAQGGIMPADYALVLGANTPAPSTVAPAPAPNPPPVQRGLAIDQEGLHKVQKDLRRATKDLPGKPDAASTDITKATEDLAAAMKTKLPDPVSHFFVSAGYQVANPYAFVPRGASTTTTVTTSGGSTTTTTTTTPPPAGANGSIKPSTTSGLFLELDYLNRLAWDPVRYQRFKGDGNNNYWGPILNPLSLANWDVESRLFFSLSSSGNNSSGSTSGASGTTSSGTTTSATTLVGSGDFGAEVAATQNFLLLDRDIKNIQTVGLEERWGGSSDRSGFRNHSEEFVGLDYTIGHWLEGNPEPIRLNFRGGYAWLDTVSFVNGTSTEIGTINGTPNYSQKGYCSIQSEVLVPLGKSAFLTVGGRVYFGHTRPAPWTSYIGYTIELPALAQALHIGGATTKTDAETK